jgi:hypothetical protein
METNRRLAAQRQIEGSIRHFHAGAFECAITLALAAEGQVPDTDTHHLFLQLKRRASALLSRVNSTLSAIWLKHYSADKPDEIRIEEFDVVIALVRATSKFIAFYGHSSGEIEAFVEWVRAHNYLDGQSDPPAVERLS